ncbi:hypothetical protein PPHE_a1359 [Pseudoalteromonas phenolica O-BC30]|nr:hypothetical protein [Pseudoalteromonas phenolica O-BC30]
MNKFYLVFGFYLRNQTFISIFAFFLIMLSLHCDLLRASK